MQPAFVVAEATAGGFRFDVVDVESSSSSSSSPVVGVVFVFFFGAGVVSSSSSPVAGVVDCVVAVGSGWPAAMAALRMSASFSCAPA